MANQGEKKPLARSLESLGWLASSGSQPKKRREIEGVGTASLVAMQAQVFKAQQEAAMVREGKMDPAEMRDRRKGSVGALRDRKNSGVAQRDQKDRLEIKTTADRMSESRAALEKKAALYDRLARGEVDDEDAKYEVDFLMKGGGGGGGGGSGGWAQQGELDTTGLAVQTETGGLMHADMARERERRSWEAEEQATMAAEEQTEQLRKQRRELLNEVIDEAADDREQAATARAQRAAAEARKRERLKAAFLKKQMEQLKQQGKKGQGQGQQQQGSGGGA